MEHPERHLALATDQETLNGNIRTRQNVQTRDEYQVSTVAFLNNVRVWTSGLSLFTHDLHVDVESARELLPDLHVIRSFVVNLDNGS